MRLSDLKYVDWGFVAACGFFGTLLVGGVGAMGGLIAHGINMAVVDSAYKKEAAKIEAGKTMLIQTIEKKANIDNFDIASVELGKAQDKYIFKAFGSTSYEEIVGLKQNKYLNVFFDISKADAENILKAVQNLDNVERTRDLSSPEHSAVIDEDKINDWIFSEKGRLNKTADACVDLYSVLSEAVNNAYTFDIEEIAEASKTNNTISQAYRYMRPEVVGDTTVTGFLTHGSTTFLNAGVMTTGISQVVKNEEKGVSYFLIDTLQARPVGGDMVVDSCRAMVEVDGTELSQEEVYAKFIAGQYSSFTEIAREKVGVKTGVVNNELTQDVEEIELL